MRPACFSHRQLRLLVPSSQRGLGQFQIFRDLPDAAIADLAKSDRLALNSFVNFRRFRFSMGRSRRILAHFGVSTKEGQGQLLSDAS
jgi:hypothetical protein